MNLEVRPYCTNLFLDGEFFHVALVKVLKKKGLFSFEKTSTRGDDSIQAITRFDFEIKEAIQVAFV